LWDYPFNMKKKGFYLVVDFKKESKNVWHLPILIAD
jgi:hypothetical protein